MASRDGAPAGQAAPLVDTVPPLASPTPKAPTATSPTAPPETESYRRRRTYIILAFWVIIAFLGLPIWWKTMSIYRANLPLSEMNEWAEGKVCLLVAHHHGELFPC
jgi:phosphatidylinositol glycan class S